MRARTSNIDLDAIADSIVSVFPALDLFEQRLSLELYRLLAEGQPVPRSALAERLGATVEVVNRALDGWPGVFSDSQQRVTGYCGLSIPTAFSSPHRFNINGRTLSAWCAWDTLFLPQLLGQAALVDSVSPISGAIVRLTVRAEGIDEINPAGAQISFLLPDAAEVRKDLVRTFCHFVHYFPSLEAGESWVAQHPGTFILSIDEAHLIARRKNEAQYGDILAAKKRT